MAQSLSVAEHSFSGDDKVVIDTNVLILLYARAYMLKDEDIRIDRYASALEELEAAGGEGLLLDTVLSEFINAFERVAADHWFKTSLLGQKARAGYRKRFREATEPYGQALNRITEAVKDLSSRFTYDHTKTLTDSEALEIIEKMRRFSADLNDIRIAEYCTENQAKMLSDDGDMARIEGDFKVITTLRA